MTPCSRRAIWSAPPPVPAGTMNSTGFVGSQALGRQRNCEGDCGQRRQPSRARARWSRLADVRVWPRGISIAIAGARSLPAIVIPPKLSRMRIGYGCCPADPDAVSFFGWRILRGLSMRGNSRRCIPHGRDAIVHCGKSHAVPVRGGRRTVRKCVRCRAGRCYPYCRHNVTTGGTSCRHHDSVFRARHAARSLAFVVLRWSLGLRPGRTGAAAARAQDLAPVSRIDRCRRRLPRPARAEVRRRCREAHQRHAQVRGLSGELARQDLRPVRRRAQGRARHVGAPDRLRRRRGARGEPRPDAGADHELRAGAALEGGADRQGMVEAARGSRHQDRDLGVAGRAASPGSRSRSCRPTTPRE